MGQRRGEIVTRDRCASIFGIARTTLDDWVKRGCPVHKPSPGRGIPAEFDTAAVADWRVNEATLGDAGESPDLTKERARLAREQADKAAMENAQLRRELLPAVEVQRADEAIWAALRDRLRAIPMAVADVGVEAVGKGGAVALAEVVRQHIDDALEQVGTAEVLPDDADDQGSRGQ